MASKNKNTKNKNSKNKRVVWKKSAGAVDVNTDYPFTDEVLQVREEEIFAKTVKKHLNKLHQRALNKKLNENVPF